MAWSVEQWKENAARNVRRIGAWLGHKTPYAVYSALCGLSLWPLVEAARVALGDVAGGVGGNLLAEQVQRWADRGRGKDADAAHAVAWVAERAPEDADLRKALDAILERLEALPEARSALEAPERAAFDAALRRELAALGSLPRFAAQLEGSGAIAQGAGAAAVGAGGTLVQGDVAGDVVTGVQHADFYMPGQQVHTQINLSGGVVVVPSEERAGRAGRRAVEENEVSKTINPQPARVQAGDRSAAVEDRAAGWESATVRRLLTAALSEAELDALCFDHFRPVCDEFAPEMGKAQKIQRLLAYCDRYDQMEKLLRLVQAQNPAQFERYRPK